MVNNLILELQRNVAVGDIVISRKRIGKIIRILTDGNNLILSRFVKLNDLPPEVLVPRLSIHDFPILAQSQMPEVVLTSETFTISRGDVEDLCFIETVNIIGCGFARCIGVKNAFFIRFRLLENHTIGDYIEPSVQSYFTLQPMSKRIFESLQRVSHAICTLFWAKRAITRKKKKILFSSEGFGYLLFKLIGRNNGILFQTTLRNFRELRKKTISTLSFVTKGALDELRNVLGSIIGIGISKDKPTKNNKQVLCSISTVINSLELPNEVVAHPSNFLEFKYNNNDSMLSIRTTFSRVVLNRPEDITSRCGGVIGALCSTDDVYEVVEIGALFLSNGVLKEVVAITSEGFVKAVNFSGRENSETFSLGDAATLIRALGM